MFKVERHNHEVVVDEFEIASISNYKARSHLVVDEFEIGMILNQ